MLNLTEEQVKDLINTKPTTSIMIGLSSLKKINVDLSDVKIDSSGKKHRTLSIENTLFNITEEQAEQIFKTMEPKIYDETFAELEEKYLTERVKRKHLEEELELLKERLREVV